MKFLAASALTLGLGLFAMTSSQAMPLAPLGQTAANDAVITVSGGCGWGWHRGPLAAVARPTTALPAGIPARTASAASATGNADQARAASRGPRHLPRKPSSSSSYFSRASRNTRWPVFGITSARAFGISCGQRLREFGVLAHLRPQRFRRIGPARRIVVVGAHDEQRRLRDQRDLMHHRLAIDHLVGRDEGAQPARIVGAALDVEAGVDKGRDLVRRQLQRVIGLELLAVAFGGQLVLGLDDLLGRRPAARRAGNPRARSARSAPDARRGRDRRARCAPRACRPSNARRCRLWRSCR